MLSIIIASNRNENFEKVCESIHSSIDVPFEIIRADNVCNGLSAAYNRAAELSQFSYLCFVHDDILFQTKGWCTAVTGHLENKEVGVIGVMGGRYKSAFGLGWRDGFTRFYRYNLADGLNGGKRLHFNPNETFKEEVICLDGAFLCCRKEVWQEFKFDSVHFRGFHFYDTDFCFRVASKYKNFMIDKILLEHYSHGNIDKHYINDSLIFDQLHTKKLPASIEKLPKNEVSRLEGFALSAKLQYLKKFKFPIRIRAKLLATYFLKYLNFYQLIRCLYFGFFKP